jgi:hypothetical protein
MVGNIRSTNDRRYTIVIVSVPPKPPRPPQGGAPQVPKPPQPGKPQPPVDQSVARPLGPKRVTRSMAAPVPVARQAELDPDELLKQQLLAEVVQHAKRETRAVMLAKAMESFKTRPFIVMLAALFTIAVTGYSYATRAEWVFGARPAVSAQREGYLRFAMFLAAQRVAAYRETNLVLPGSLAEAGECWPGISYRVIGDSLFEISATSDSGTVMTLRSDRDAGAFVGLGSTALRRNVPENGGAR